jgi:hypothetical protein
VRFLRRGTSSPAEHFIGKLKSLSCRYFKLRARDRRKLAPQEDQSIRRRLPPNGEFAEILKKLMALPRYGTTIEIVEMIAHLADPTLVHHGCDPHH